MPFQIEKGFPLPSNIRGYQKYPWQQMEVGDSFFVPEAVAKQSNISGAARSAAKRYERAFVARPVEGGTRVWRTA